MNTKMSITGILLIDDEIIAISDIKTLGNLAQVNKDSKERLFDLLEQYGKIRKTYIDQMRWYNSRRNDKKFNNICDEGFFELAKWYYNMYHPNIHYLTDFNFSTLWNNNKFEMAQWLFNISLKLGKPFEIIKSNYWKIPKNVVQVEWLHNLAKEHGQEAKFDVELIFSYNYLNSNEVANIEIMDWFENRYEGEFIDQNKIVTFIKNAICAENLNVIKWLESYADKYNITIDYQQLTDKEINKTYKSQDFIEWIYGLYKNDKIKFDLEKVLNKFILQVVCYKEGILNRILEISLSEEIKLDIHQNDEELMKKMGTCAVPIDDIQRIFDLGDKYNEPIDIHYDEETFFRNACGRNIDMAKWLYQKSLLQEKPIDPSVKNFHSFLRMACNYNYKNQEKINGLNWLYSLPTKEPHDFTKIIRRICLHKKEILKWFLDRTPNFNIHEDDEFIFRKICKYSKFESAQYLYYRSLAMKDPINIRAKNDDAFLRCYMKSIEYAEFDRGYAHYDPDDFYENGGYYEKIKDGSENVKTLKWLASLVPDYWVDHKHHIENHKNHVSVYFDSVLNIGIGTKKYNSQDFEYITDYEEYPWVTRVYLVGEESDVLDT